MAVLGAKTNQARTLRNKPQAAALIIEYLFDVNDREFFVSQSCSASLFRGLPREFKEFTLRSNPEGTVCVVVKDVGENALGHGRHLPCYGERKELPMLQPEKLSP